MNSFIEHIEITNFKSIRHLEMDGFKKINLFIGKPNVGKSNILEALSVFTIPYLKDNPSKKISDMIRMENLTDFFHNWNIGEKSIIEIKEDEEKFICKISYKVEAEKESLNFFNYHQRLNRENNGSIYNHSDYKVNKDLEYSYGELNYAITHIKRYIFKASTSPANYSIPFLYPPFGINLLYVLERLPKLMKTIAYWFEQYGLKLVLDRANNSVRIQKEIGENEVLSLPYSSIADTLQRIIFYKTAIASNKDSVLIFEEPEAHAYPPYIAEFTQEVINSETNQFFMATHSPIVVNDFLENAIDDLAIFMVDFKDGQTKVKGLSREEIEDVYKYGIDLFFNGESYPVL